MAGWHNAPPVFSRGRSFFAGWLHFAIKKELKDPDQKYSDHFPVRQVLHANQESGTFYLHCTMPANYPSYQNLFAARFAFLLPVLFLWAAYINCNAWAGGWN